jgi:hypothetical protein
MSWGQSQGGGDMQPRFSQIPELFAGHGPLFYLLGLVVLVQPFKGLGRC